MADPKENKTAAPAKAPVKAKVEMTKNPLAIKWPTDPQGVMGPLRDGGLKAAARIRGDEAKMRKFLEYLEILAAHAKVKYKADVAAKAVAKENSLSARARVAERLKREAEAKAKEYIAAAARVRATAGIEVETDEKEG